jgi:hypothetical protein
MNQEVETEALSLQQHQSGGDLVIHYFSLAAGDFEIVGPAFLVFITMTVIPSLNDWKTGFEFGTKGVPICGLPAFDSRHSL